MKDLHIIETKVHVDHRGWLTESFNADKYFEILGCNLNFVQEVHSYSKKWVLRGLHYQNLEPQAKLVKVISGKIFDVTVDLRINSKAFGKWFGMELSSENQKQLFIPPGFAHGFLSLKNDTEIIYKVTKFYNINDEYSLAWNDKKLKIDWPIPYGISPILSSKDTFGITWDSCPKYAE